MIANVTDAQGKHTYLGQDSVMIENGDVLPILVVGNFKIPYTNVTLSNNVLIVLTNKKNLLSISQFTKDLNHCFLFHPWGFVVKDLKTNKVILK